MKGGHNINFQVAATMLPTCNHHVCSLCTKIGGISEYYTCIISSLSINIKCIHHLMDMYIMVMYWLQQQDQKVLFNLYWSIAQSCSCVYHADHNCCQQSHHKARETPPSHIFILLASKTLIYCMYFYIFVMKVFH